MGRGINNGGKTLVLDLTIAEAHLIYEAVNYTASSSVAKVVNDMGCKVNFKKDIDGAFTALQKAGAKDENFDKTINKETEWPK